ncbi:MAG TPA: ABC transporter substrate-binding protein [Dehalococcoidia bacterium]|nr:ABC transporter substrate-binding protein [Dehalococcoidia bacterium]
MRRHLLTAPVPRRALLSAAASSGVALALAACGAGARRGRAGQAVTTPSASATPGIWATVASGAAVEAAGRPGGTLSFVAERVPASYDFVVQGETSSALAGLCCNGLLAPRNGTALFPDPADDTLVPDLVQALPEQPDEQTFIFRLRPDVHWQAVPPLNGRALVAADVQWFFQRALTDARSLLRPRFGVIDRVDTPDAATVRFALSEPYAPFLSLVAGGAARFIQPRELGDGGRLGETLIGTGPFVLDTSAGARKPVFRRNPGYFKSDRAGARLPYLDQLALLTIPDAAARMQAYQARQAQLTASLAPSDAAALKASNPYDFAFGQMPGVSNYLYMRVDQPPFDDQRVRQALSLALDRPAMLQALGGGTGVPDLPVPALLRRFSTPLSALGDAARFYTRDLQAAKQLLAAAGHADGLSTTLTFTPQYGDLFVKAAQLVQGYLREVGIQTTPVQLDYARYLTTAFRGDFAGLAYAPREVYPDPDPYLSDYYLPGGLRYQDHSNDAALQALVLAQRRATDLQTRVSLLAQIQRLLSETQYRVYDVAPAGAMAWQNDVLNYRASLWSALGRLEVAWLRGAGKSA